MLVRRYKAEILPIRRKTPYNQSINHTMLALDPSLSTILDIQHYQLLAQGSLIKPKIDFTTKHSILKILKILFMMNVTLIFVQAVCDVRNWFNSPE